MFAIVVIVKFLFNLGAHQVVFDISVARWCVPVGSWRSGVADQ